MFVMFPVSHDSGDQHTTLVLAWGSRQLPDISKGSHAQKGWKPLVSSYFHPNREFVDRYADSDRFDIVSSEEVNITRLDNFDIEYADFMKLDIQGGELEALKEAEKKKK